MKSYIYASLLFLGMGAQLVKGMEPPTPDTLISEAFPDEARFKTNWDIASSGPESSAKFTSEESATKDNSGCIVLKIEKSAKKRSHAVIGVKAKDAQVPEFGSLQLKAKVFVPENPSPGSLVALRIDFLQRGTKIFSDHIQTEWALSDLRKGEWNDLTVSMIPPAAKGRELIPVFQIKLYTRAPEVDQYVYVDEVEAVFVDPSTQKKP